MLGIGARCWSAGSAKAPVTGMCSSSQSPKCFLQHLLLGHVASHPSPAAVVAVSSRQMATLRTKNPRSPHRVKAKLLKTLEPIYAPDTRTLAEKCTRQAVVPSIQDRPPHTLEVLLAQEVRRVLAASKMVVICHRNYMQMETIKSYRNAVWKLNLRLWPQFNNKIMRLAFEGTKYATLSPFLETTNLMITSSELSFTDVTVGLKRIPTVVPLAVVVNGEYVISVPQLEIFAKKYRAGIADAHGELVAAMSSHSQNLLQALMYQGVTLSSCLSFMSKSSTPEPSISSQSEAEKT